MFERFRGDLAIFCILLFSLPLSSFSQPRADSLQALLKTAYGKERAEILLELGGYTRLKDFKKAISQAEEALQISRNIGDQELIGKSLRRLGYFYSTLEQTGKSLEYYLEALHLEQINNNPAAEAEVLYQLGRFYYDQDNYEKALAYYFRTLRLQRSIGDREGTAETLYFIGAVNGDREDYDNALHFYKRSYDLAIQLKDHRQTAMAASEIGIVNQNIDSLDQALEYYNKALESSEKLNSSHAQASILLHMSSVYRDKDHFQKAVKLNKEQIAIGKSYNNKAIEAQGLQNLADLYYEHGDHALSFKNLRLAGEIYKDLGYRESEIIVNNQLAEYLLEENLPQTIKVSTDALADARSEGMIGQQISALNNLIRAYIRQDNYHEAFLAKTRLTAFRDSVFTMEKEKQIASLQTRYNTEEKEKEIALLQKEQEKSRFIRIALVSGFLLLLIIGILLISRQRIKIKKNRAELENYLLKKEKLKSDLDYRTKQLTTHSLNLIQKNETIRELKSKISEINTQIKDSEVSKKLHAIEHLVDYSFNLDKDWEEFRLYFGKVHPDFFKKLKEKYSDLTPNDFRVSALVKLQLSTKEVATIMGITPDSVKTARYRLRKKLDLETEDNLTEFLMDI